MTLVATLFDMDGLLIDSEVLWHEAEVEVFGSLGVPISEAEDRSTKGMFVNEVVAFWRERYPWRGPDDGEVAETLLARVGDLVESKGRLLPGALRALDLTGSRGPLALASSTPLALIVRCLDHFALRGRFDAITSAEFEAAGKPDPAVFLTAAGMLRVDPVRCLVVEDSAAGVEAALAAAMTVVAVPASEDRGLDAFAGADLVLDSLEQLTEAWLDERFAR
ncbi:MAG TPA: hexitol phosphatase HxpB [Acidimicrobiales bacterium]|nr:hexitol phosphatase HxpB [Acidimicrobiales bacterium]